MTRSLPDAKIESSGEDPLRSNLVNERVSDLGAPGAAVDTHEADDGVEFERGVVNCVTASRSTSPENERCVIQNGEGGWVRRTQVIVWLVHCLTNWRGPVETAVSVREPDIPGLIAIG